MASDVYEVVSLVAGCSSQTGALGSSGPRFRLRASTGLTVIRWSSLLPGPGATCHQPPLCNVSTLISGRAPTRTGGPQNPAPRVTYS